jgi:hypothetical protein
MPEPAAGLDIASQLDPERRKLLGHALGDAVIGAQASACDDCFALPGDEQCAVCTVLTALSGSYHDLGLSLGFEPGEMEGNPDYPAAAVHARDARSDVPTVADDRRVQWGRELIGEQHDPALMTADELAHLVARYHDRLRMLLDVLQDVADSEAADAETETAPADEEVKAALLAALPGPHTPADVAFAESLATPRWAGDAGMAVERWLRRAALHADLPSLVRLIELGRIDISEIRAAIDRAEDNDDIADAEAACAEGGEPVDLEDLDL